MWESLQSSSFTSKARKNSLARSLIDVSYVRRQLFALVYFEDMMILTLERNCYNYIHSLEQCCVVAAQEVEDGGTQILHVKQIKMNVGKMAQWIKALAVNVLQLESDPHPCKVDRYSGMHLYSQQSYQIGDRGRRITWKLAGQLAWSAQHGRKNERDALPQQGRRSNALKLSSDLHMSVHCPLSHICHSNK